MAVKTVQAVINGVTTTLTYNSTSKKYEATITAPATSSYNNNDGHYFPVTIKAQKMTQMPHSEAACSSA